MVDSGRKSILLLKSHHAVVPDGGYWATHGKRGLLTSSEKEAEISL